MLLEVSPCPLNGLLDPVNAVPPRVRTALPLRLSILEGIAFVEGACISIVISAFAVITFIAFDGSMVSLVAVATITTIKSTTVIAFIATMASIVDPTSLVARARIVAASPIRLSGLASTRGFRNGLLSRQRPWLAVSPTPHSSNEEFHSRLISIPWKRSRRQFIASIRRMDTIRNSANIRIAYGIHGCQGWKRGWYGGSISKRPRASKYHQTGIPGRIHGTGIIPVALDCYRPIKRSFTLFSQFIANCRVFGRA